MPPYLGNETITRIFQRLYESLCNHPVHVEPDVPIGAKVVFSQLALVSKRFHSLALPFLVRHFDGRNVGAFTEFIKKYNLASSVESFYLDPQLFGYEDPEPLEDWPEDEDFFMAYQARAIREEAMEKVEAIHQKARKRELARWKPLLKLCIPHIAAFEIGSRRRKMSEEGPYVGN